MFLFERSRPKYPDLLLHHLVLYTYLLTILIHIVLNSLMVFYYYIALEVLSQMAYYNTIFLLY